MPVGVEQWRAGIASCENYVLCKIAKVFPIGSIISEDNKHFLLHCPLFSNYRVNLHGELSEFLHLDLPNLDDNFFCSLLSYGSAEFPYIIYRMILEATIKYIKSSKRFDRVDYET